MRMPRSSQQCCCAYTRLTAIFTVPLNSYRLLSALFLLVSAFCFPPAALAQSSTATLSGTVEDQKGAVVPGATIALINADQGTQRLMITDSDGSFIFPLLPPGRYSITATATGFAPVERKDVVLNVNDQITIKLRLTVGNISETIQIVDTSILNESPALATTVDRQFVGNLALNGRSFQALIALTPGVVLTKTSGNERGQFSVNGQRANANYFTVDGVSANIGVVPTVIPGQSAGGSLPAFSAFGGTSNLVSIDALEEFKVQTSTYAPEFGRTPGAQVQILTRSGTNDFHGTLFDYVRNDALDANDWFNNARGLPKPATRQHDFGGVLGGPVLLPRFGEGGHQPGYNGRNRTFFFFSYEGLRLRLPQSASTFVPSLAARQNAPAALQPFLNAFPVPNGATLANGFAVFNSSFSNPAKLNATSIRIDHTVNDRFTLFGRYNYAPSETIQRGVGTSLSTVNPIRNRTQTLTFGNTFAASAHVSNDFRVNWSRTNGASFFFVDDFGGAVIPSDGVLFPSFATRDDAQIQFILRGTTNSNFRVGTVADNVQRQFNLVDNLAVVFGRHQLKLGVDYRRLTPIFDSANYAQTLQFAGIAGALSSTARSVDILGTMGPLVPVFTNLSIYSQDTWKLSRRLTITYGLRWEYNPPPTELTGISPIAVTQTDDLSKLALAPSGTPLWKATYNNFAPRFGFAYQLRQRAGRETVLRGGVGIFYDLGDGPAANAFSAISPFRASRPTLFNVPFPLSSDQVAAPLFSSTPPFNTSIVFDPNLKLPRTYQWNFTLEQSLGAKQVLSASYVAAVGRRLLRQIEVESPNADFVLVDVLTNGATSDYHAMQLQFQRRLSRGLQGLASYTWSHSIDIASNDSGVHPPDQIIPLELDRGPSDFDVRHAFTGAVTYNIPDIIKGGIGKSLFGNWSVDAILSARSATPVDVIYTTFTSFGFTEQLRPDLLLGVPLYLDDPAAPGGRRINPASFSIPATERQGTLGRNALRGFPVYQVDFGLGRQFRLTERSSVQFKAEFFNIFNHPNFGDPNGTLDFFAGFAPNPDFGLSQSMLGRSLGSGGLSGGFNPLYQIGGPRSIQLSLKLKF
ncbi:MAG TPA: TonB-dependent receptor [Pyrinomonadaceae bacterium]|nr:TonB-dependent receptor [Pyrinomonadaceae bacterium]